MNFPNDASFKAIPLTILNTSGDHFLQAAIFFKKRLYVGATSFSNGLAAPGISRLLRYYPSAERWEIVHEIPVKSPFLLGSPPRYFPLELGWRAMHATPANTGSDALYITHLSLHHSQLLYTEDGVHFEALPNPGRTHLPSTPFSLLYSFKDWLFAAPTGAMSDGITEKNDGGALLYVTHDPRTEDWQPANSPGFGDPHNQVIHGLHIFDDWLYASVGNPFAGFQLWRTKALEVPPFKWELVLKQGTQRYTFNSAIAAMAVFKDALYLGTGIPETEPLLNEVAGAEVIRLLPNDQWELVVGQPRFSPIGLQVPISTQGPGFGNNQNTLVAALVSSSTALYAAVVRRNSKGVGGFQLWQTIDGDNWQPLASPSFAVTNARSLRVLLAIPKFLLVAGTWRFDDTDAASEPCLWYSQCEK